MEGTNNTNPATQTGTSGSGITVSSSNVGRLYTADAVSIGGSSHNGTVSHGSSAGSVLSGLSTNSNRSKADNERDVDLIYQLFSEFRDAYIPEWQRLERCERLYLGKHWDDVPLTDINEPRPVTPIIQSTIENVRAELTDWYPEAVIVADDPLNKKQAEVLNAAIRENHISCDFEREYGKLIYDLLVGGYMVSEVGFDAEQNFGLGGAYIRHVDNRCIMFDPNSAEIDDCRAIFKFCPHSMDWYREHYPKQSEQMVTDELLLSCTDGVLRSTNDDSALLIECWRRVFDDETGRYRVHMTKAAGRVLLEDSRDYKEEGLYSHGKYPFSVTKLFMRKGCCLGYGFADMFERQQRFADKLDQIVLKNALMASHNKLLVGSSSGFDPADLCDWSKEVHRGENINAIKWFSTAPLPAYIIQYSDKIRDSIRQEAGANDFSRGTTTNGVTAASAIAALQEMSNKRSRTVAKCIHAAFAEAVRMEIEVEREYAVLIRNITVNSGDSVQAQYCRNLLRDKTNCPLEFKVSVKVQRENKFSVMSHNETIIKLMEIGVLSKETGLSLLVFDGKDEAIARMEKERQEAIKTDGE